jgi:hypothetical protein
VQNCIGYRTVGSGCRKSWIFSFAIASVPPKMESLLFLSGSLAPIPEHHRCKIIKDEARSGTKKGAAYCLLPQTARNLKKRVNVTNTPVRYQDMLVHSNAINTLPP